MARGDAEALLTGKKPDTDFCRCLPPVTFVHMRPFLLFLPLLALFACNNQPAQNQSSAAPGPKDSLRMKLQELIRDRKGTVGMAVMSMDDPADTLSINGDRFFPLMSVAKFPQALCLLHLADQGKYDLSKPIELGPEDLKQGTGSQIREDHPQSSFRLSITEALRYSIGQSDNITSNKIFELEGGPAAVETYVHSLGIPDIAISTDYRHMRPDSPMQNRGTPKALAQLLYQFHHHKLLADSTHALLWTALVEATSGANRIKAGLPEGTVFGHKTGTSSTNEATGITPAFNDVGLVRLPDGRYYGIAIFIGDSKEPYDDNAALMAALSKAVWAYYTRSTK